MNASMFVSMYGEVSAERAAREEVVRETATDLQQVATVPSSIGAAQRGFTLIEVMAALLIFVTGVIGVLAMFTSGLALHRDAERRAIITNVSDEVRSRVESWLAEAILAAKNGGAVDLPKIEGVPVAEYDGYFYSAELSLDPELGLPGGLFAKVFVYTNDVGKLRGSQFTVFVPAGARPELEIRDALGIGRVESVPQPVDPNQTPQSSGK